MAPLKAQKTLSKQDALLLACIRLLSKIDSHNVVLPKVIETDINRISTLVEAISQEEFGIKTKKPVLESKEVGDLS